MSKSCRIPYENLKTLFIKSLSYDRAKYRFYRASIDNIINSSLQDEAKVHAIWFMGILYNQTLNLESSVEENGIVTEGLPIKISDLVKDKLYTENVDYEEVLKDLKSLLAEPIAADEADLSELSTSDKKEKSLTTAQKLNKIFIKLTKGSDATLNDLFTEFEDIINKDVNYNNETKIQAYDKFLQGISKLKNTSATSLRGLINQKKNELVPQQEVISGLVNVRNIPVFGDMYYVRQQNGDIKLIVFKNGAYYIYDSIYDGQNETELEQYIVEPSDYITPIYGKDNLEVTNSTGSTYRLNSNLAKNGFTFEGVRIYEQGIQPETSTDNRTGHQKISDNLSLGTGITKQIKVIADKRRIKANRSRIDFLNSQGYSIDFENSLTPTQLDYLLRNPNKGPIVTTLLPRAGFDLIVSSADEAYWDYIMSLDTLGFVYADGTTRFIDWDNNDDIKLFQEATTVKRYGEYTQDANNPRQSYTYEKLTNEEINNLRNVVSKLREMKYDIAETMDEDADFQEIDPEIFSKYFNVSNVITYISNQIVEKNSLYKPVQTLDNFKSNNLTATNSLIPVRIAQMSAGDIIPSTVREENVIGIIKKDPRLGFVFQQSIEQGYLLLDENNNKISYEQLFEKQGLSQTQITELLNNEVNSKYGYFYLIKTKNDKWLPKPMQFLAPATQASEKINFLSTLNALTQLRPQYSEETLNELNELIRKYNNKGWGFNAYKGISANIDFIRNWNGEDVYGIKFRASGDYANAEALNKANLKIEFNFDYRNIEKQLKILYKELNISPKVGDKSIESKFNFGNELQEKIDKNQHLLTPAAKEAIKNIEKEFDNTVSKLYKDLNELLETESKKIDNPTINRKDQDIFKYVLFRNKNGTEFKLASRQKTINPLLNYKVFEPTLNNNNSVRELVVVPAKASLGTAATTINIKTTPVVQENQVNETSLDQATKETPKVKLGIKRRFNIANTLDGLAFVGDKEIQDQINDVKRMLGSTVKIDPTIIEDKAGSNFILGYFENNVITLNKLLPVSGVVYHEAFHAIFRLALTNEERLSYLEAAKTILGNSKTDSSGKYLTVGNEKVYLNEFRKKRNYAGVADDIIVDYIYEEYLADGYKDYKLNKTEPKNSLIKKLYSLLDKLISLFTSSQYKKAKNKINELYQNIDSGIYADVIGDKYSAPRAYSLPDIPSGLIIDNDEATVSYTQVDNYTVDQLVDRLTREMLKRSGDIIKKDQASFNKVYDEVTAELIKYFNVNTFITDDNKINIKEITATYEPMFKNMRYMMGSLHRFNEQFNLNNLTENSDYDGISVNDIEGAAAESFQEYDKIKNLVQKSYEQVGVIKENKITSEEDEQDREDSEENLDDDNEKLEESEIGENYQDEGILFYKPYEGNAEFQRLIKYVKYTFTDEKLGVSFDKMVNSRDIINQIRKISYNVPQEKIVLTIYNHIEYLKSQIDKFKESDLAKSGIVPEDMSILNDQYYMIKAVYDTLNEQTNLNDAFLPTIANGQPFFNMFVKVFYRANKSISTITIDTKYEDQDPNEKTNTVIRNAFFKNDLIEKYNINIAEDKLRNNLNYGIESLSLMLRGKLTELLRDYNYVIPTTQEKFDYEVNQLYTITSIAKLNIPRNVLEFAIAASVRKNYGAQATFIDDILNQNLNFFTNGNYFDIRTFVKNYEAILIADNTKNINSRISATNTFINEYIKVAPYQIKYDPSLTSNVVLNQDGKPINQSIPYVPSVEILSEIRSKGLEPTLEKYYGDTYFFYDNPILASVLNNSSYDPSNEDLQSKKEDSYRVFFENLDITIAGGMSQKFDKGKRRQSTYKKLGDKGYVLSVLGLFANRRIVKGNYGQDIILFDRPITQLEAKSTQFNITALYENYTLKNRKDKITTKLKQILKQEYERICLEWATKDIDKLRYEGYNCKTLDDRTVITNDLNLRAYQFNNLSSFFNREVDSGSELDNKLYFIYNSFLNAAITSTIDENDELLNIKFEEILAESYYIGNKKSDLTINDVLSDALFDYAEDTMKDLANYFESLNIKTDDLPAGIQISDEFIRMTQQNKIQEGNKTKYYYNEEDTKIVKDQFIKDFGYNFWFNSLFINQLFDGDLAVGIKDVVSFFKRQKSAVIAGNNYRNINVPESNDVTSFAVFKTFNGYLSANDTLIPLNTNIEIGGKSRQVKPFDGQAVSSIDRRIKKFIKDGIYSPDLLKLLRKLRYTTLDETELLQLNENGIYLGSDKPAVGHPYFYYKDSEHYINRTDVSIVSDANAVAELYDKLDSLELDNVSFNSDTFEEYQSIVKEIHSYFQPKRGRELMHHILNSLEYFKVDVVLDETASKKATVQPLIIDLSLLENGILEGHGNMKVGDIETPVIKDGYINLSYNKHNIPNNVVYEQVSTTGIANKVTDSIQKKLLITAQLDSKKFPKVKRILDLQSEIVKSRMQVLERLFLTEDPKTIVAKAIQAGFIKQGAGDNLLKLYSIDKETGKSIYNLNLPILGKTPLFYFFSLFNNSVFGPKISGKKFFHVSGVGYKLVVDKNNNPISRNELDKYPERYEGYDTRYPTIKEVLDEKGEVKEIVVEVIIPRELASSPEDVKFFEQLYSDFLATRIPTAERRSMVRAQVVDFIDASYGNSIIVPAQIHFFAGSDLDIDSLYAETYASYRNSLGKMIKYGDYTAYTKLGLNLKNAKFVEYLHYMADDAIFADLIDSEQDRIKSDPEFRTRSLKNAVGLFGDQVEKFFTGTEEYIMQLLEPEVFKELSKGKEVALSIKTTNNKNKKKAIGLESLGELMEANVVVSNKKLGNILKLMDRLIAVVNVINNYGLPSTPQELEEFTKSKGNIVHSTLHNEILKEKLDILGNPEVYKMSYERADAEQYINAYKADRNLISNISDYKTNTIEDPYTFQTVSKYRSINGSALESVGPNANVKKGAALLATSNIKLSKDFTFKFVHNGKQIATNKPVEDSVQKVGGATDVSLDDAQHQTQAPLRISKYNSSLVNALYIYGYPPQFVRLIHSVDLIAKTLKEFDLTQDPSYGRSKPFNMSFSTYLNKKILDYVNNPENVKRLQKLGILKPSKNKINKYEIDHSKITIEFKDVEDPLNNNKLDDFNITIKNSDGVFITDNLGSIVLLSFYNEFTKVGNAILFKISKITDVNKQLKPSFKTLSTIKNAVKFIEENEIFENAKDIFKEYPYLGELNKNALDLMITKSKEVLLDETNLFKAFTSLFQYDKSMSIENVIQEVKSILALSTLNTYVTSKIKGINEDNMSPEDTFIKALHDATTINYWENNQVINDLQTLKNKFPKNEFLASLTNRPVLYSNKGKVQTIISLTGNKLSVENQNRIINDFYQLISDTDKSVYAATINIAVHGIVKDGGMFKNQGFLKVIAPELFKYMSKQLDLIQNKLYKIDTTKDLTSAKYLNGLDEFFKEVYNGAPIKKSKAGNYASPYITSILTKLVSSLTKESEGNPNLSMSFYQGGDLYGPGKFGDISLQVLKSLVDQILPKNASFIYTFGLKSPKSDETVMLPIHKNVTRRELGKPTRYELWKADDNNELYFDLSNLSKIDKDIVKRILQAQDIYETKDGNYSFPLYQINNYNDNQIFLLTELNGKPFTSEFIENLFDAYKSEDQFQFLLRGITAKYKVIERQNLDRVSPNAFTNKTAVELKKVIDNTPAPDVQPYKFIEELPSTVELIPNSSYLKVFKSDLDKVVGSKYIKGDQILTIGSTKVKYSARSGRVFIDTKTSNEQQKNEFANKLGFSSFEEAVKDITFNEWLNSKKSIEYWLVPYVSEMLENENVNMPVITTQPQATVAQPSTSVEETLVVPKYEINKNLKNTDGSKRFASSNKDGVITINPVTNLQDFFDYIEGKEGGVTSQQKKLVLDELAKQDYTIDKIKNIITSNKIANTFLILHEQDHIDNNDKDVYWTQGKELNTPDKIAIEVRATVNALRKIEGTTQPSAPITEPTVSTDMAILNSPQFVVFAKEELSKNPTQSIESILEYYKICKKLL